MAVKEYKAKTIREAIGKIKEDLGPDAMILSTKRIPKGVLDPYGHDMFQVSAQYPGNGFDPENGCEPENKCKMDKKKQDVVFPPAFEMGEPHKQISSQGLDAIRDELVSIKDMLFSLDQAKGIPDILQYHPECLNLYARLIKAGVSEKRTQTLLKKVCSISGRKTFEPDEITKSVVKEIYMSISILNPFESKKKKRILAAFIGPTGVGKTTTIAKLAANLNLKQKKKVGLISIDGYRIGAVDQLKTYASIMGLPCLSAFNREDIEQAVKKMRNQDVVLIDTPGQSPLDKEKIKELAFLLGGGRSISCHLVLSATAKSSDLQESAEIFSDMNPKSYVFTKVDETRKCGGLIDQMHSLKLPVSFVTNGQKVPDDIFPATKKAISQMVLNG